MFKVKIVAGTAELVGAKCHDPGEVMVMVNRYLSIYGKEIAAGRVSMVIESY